MDGFGLDFGLRIDQLTNYHVFKCLFVEITHTHTHTQNEAVNSETTSFVIYNNKFSSLEEEKLWLKSLHILRSVNVTIIYIISLCTTRPSSDDGTESFDNLKIRT